MLHWPVDGHITIILFFSFFFFLGGGCQEKKAKNFTVTPIISDCFTEAPLH